MPFGTSFMYGSFCSFANYILAVLLIRFPYKILSISLRHTTRWLIAYSLNYSVHVTTNLAYLCFFFKRRIAKKCWFIVHFVIWWNRFLRWRIIVLQKLSKKAFVIVTLSLLLHSWCCSKKKPRKKKIAYVQWEVSKENLINSNRVQSKGYYNRDVMHYKVSPHAISNFVQTSIGLSNCARTDWNCETKRALCTEQNKLENEAWEKVLVKVLRVSEYLQKWRLINALWRICFWSKDWHFAQSSDYDIES